MSGWGRHASVFTLEGVTVRRAAPTVMALGLSRRLFTPDHRLVRLSRL